VLPAGPVGSGFLPIERADRRLDVGPRIIELGYDEPVRDAPPLADYQPGPHGHRPFLAAIDALVQSLVGDDLEEVRPPSIWRRGHTGMDFVLGGDLSGLPDLVDDQERSAIAAEAGAAAATLGPQGLLAADLSGSTLAHASRRNHGPTFHDAFIGPLAAKVLPGGADAVIAELRRKIWLPLFWPATLAEACGDAALTYLPQRPMHTVQGGGMGELVRRLLERVRAANGVRVTPSGRPTAIQRHAGAARISFGEGEPIVATDVVVALGPQEAFRLAGWSSSFERVPGRYVWVDVAEAAVQQALSVRFIVDPEIPVFRVTESNADERSGQRTFVVELAQWVAEADAPTAVRDGLRRLGIVDPGASLEVIHVLAGPSFSAPSFENRARFADGRARLLAADLPADVIGAEVFGADSFNEQVVQGLAAAARWS
jgi:hypothetical protein